MNSQDSVCLKMWFIREWKEWNSVFKNQFALPNKNWTEKQNCFLYFLISSATFLPYFSFLEVSVIQSILMVKWEMIWNEFGMIFGCGHTIIPYNVLSPKCMFLGYNCTWNFFFLMNYCSYNIHHHMTLRILSIGTYT